MVNQRDLSSVEFIWCGGASVSARNELALTSKFNLKYLQQLYGMTETSIITIKNPGSNKLGTCGSPVPGIQMKVLNYIKI